MVFPTESSHNCLYTFVYTSIQIIFIKIIDDLYLCACTSGIPYVLWKICVVSLKRCTRLISFWKAMYYLSPQFSP